MLSKQAIECSEVLILSVPLQYQDCHLSERCNSPFQCGVIFCFSLILTNPFYASSVRERCLLKTKLETIIFGRLEWRIFENQMSISTVKSTRCTSVSYLFYFCNDTLHVSGGLSIYHQEFKTVHTATGICQTDTAVCLLAGTR